MIVSIIASVSKNNVIGNNGKLPWHIPEDLKWFKEKTIGHFVLMGRKTFESIGNPLSGRKTIIITKNKNYTHSGIYVFNSINEAINFADKNNETELFIAGGEEIYRQTIEIADRIYLTRIHRNYEGDSFFPEFDADKYRVVSRKIVDTNPLIEFLLYTRS
ncbi:MAG: dihydrofolate reductase [Spirochaetes bacterium]|nr:MAG: dihydrofolate reductase [Spirochaetota bacterium]